MRTVAAEIFCALFPIGVDYPSVRLADHFHAAVGELELDIDVPLVVAKRVFQRRRVRIEIGEDQSAVGLHAWRLEQAPLRFVELLVPLALDGHAHQFAGIAIAPAVEGACEALCISHLGAADLRAPVATRIEQYPDRTVAAAHEDEGILADRAHGEVAGVR